MIIVLQIAGIAAVLAGLVTIGVGIPVKEFSFGNTLILAGTVGLCTGMLLLGLSVVALELKMVARRLAAGARSPAEPRQRGPALPPFAAAAGAAGEGGPSFSREQQASVGPGEPSVAPPVSPAPWQEDPRGRQESSMEPEPTAPTPPPKPKRNLLFASSVRKERERAAAGAADPAAGDPRAQPPAMPPLPPEAGAVPPASFEDAWPKADRQRPGEVPPQRRSRLAPAESNAAVAERAAPPPPPKAEEASAVTVLKSGVVDGMAYSLYSDGSIEAQMPEGMMRFASIDELRAHLDHRP